MLTFDEPVLIVIVYASLGALFMPFLAITLIWLLNRRIGREYRNGILANVFLAGLLFVVLGVNELIGTF